MPGPRARHSRLAISIFILLIVLSFGVGYAVYQRLVENAENQAEATLRSVADLQTEVVSSWVAERIADATTFSGGRFLGETIHDWLEAGAPEGLTKRQLREQLLAIKNSYAYLEASIVDTSGRILISTEERPMPLDPVMLETVKRAVRSSGTEVSPVHESNDADTKREVGIVSTLLNVREESSKTQSVLVLRSGSDLHLDPPRSTPTLNGRMEVLLAEVQGGKIVAVSTGINSLYFDDQDELPVPARVLEDSAHGPSDHFVMQAVDGTEVYAIARRVVGVPWYVVTMADHDSASGNVQRLAWTVAGAGAMILSLLGFTLLLWWRERESEYRLQAFQIETEKQLLQRQYDYLSKYANDMIVVANSNGRILEVNDKTLSLLGRERASLIGAPLETLYQPSSRTVLEQALTQLRTRGEAIFEDIKQTADGKQLPVETSARAMEIEGRRIIQLICRDISERVQSEAALRLSQERLNGILASIVDVVWSFSPDLTRLHYINQSAESLYGYPADTIFASPHLWFDTIHPEDRANVESTLRELRPERPMCDFEHRLLPRNDDMRWVHTKAKLVVDNHGEPIRIDGVTTDVTRRKAAEQQVQVLAYYDSVTMLPNRRLLNDRLAQAIHMAARNGKMVALLFMDLDNFKNINDSLGHHVGDMLLRCIGDRLQQCVRGEDTVARIGGDEFLVVLPEIDKSSHAAAVAEKILAATAQPYTLQENQIHTTISIGISTFPDDGREPHELIRRADSALYQAKGHGRNNYQFFTEQLNLQITRTSNIERQLRRAIDSGDLSLWYQPQIDTRDGRLIGAEALLRWRRGEKDFLSPAEFIPVAEERGLIGRIGEWAIREACRQSRYWHLQGLHTVPIAVNISPIQFQQKNFADLVTGILSESEVDPNRLELEITESAIMRRATQVAELATRLREAGVGISIDDFGTGYSSLSYLKQIPIDKIKIDRSFIKDMLHDVDDEAITYAIVNLAHSLKLRVIAEGVETREQVERLRSFGCNEVQGHYFCSAVTSEIFESFLSTGKSFAVPHMAGSNA